MRLNWAAILLAGVVDWLLGAAWFTAFASRWKAGLRMAPEEMQAYMSHPNFWPYIIALVCSIFMAYAIARLCDIPRPPGGRLKISNGAPAGLCPLNPVPQTRLI